MFETRKWEINLTALISELINFTQPIYVWREDPNSRQNTIRTVIERANSRNNWPQIIIFPEGTCTNRSCLLSFKPGAFYPGQRYEMNTVSKRDLFLLKFMSIKSNKIKSQRNSLMTV